MTDTLLFQFVLSPRGNFGPIVKTDIAARTVLRYNRFAIAAELRSLASRCEHQEWPFPSDCESETHEDEEENDYTSESGQFGVGA